MAEHQAPIQTLVERVELDPGTVQARRMSPPPQLWTQGSRRAIGIGADLIRADTRDQASDETAFVLRIFDRRVTRQSRHLGRSRLACRGITGGIENDTSIQKPLVHRDRK